MQHAAIIAQQTNVGLPLLLLLLVVVLQ